MPVPRIPGDEAPLGQPGEGSAHRLAAGPGPPADGDETSPAGAIELGEHGNGPPIVHQVDERAERALG
jgi:hypothetical protein